MATVKIKYRPSSATSKEGAIYLQVIHNRDIRQIATGYRIFREEWDAGKSAIAAASGGRATYLLAVRKHMEWAEKRLNAIIRRLKSDCYRFTADDIVESYLQSTEALSFRRFTERTIARLKRLDRERTAENYSAALNSFTRFLDGDDIPLDDIRPNLLMEYEAYLKRNGISMNTVSFYMRILRAVYNRAVEDGLTEQRNPFRRVYTGIDKTVKRAIPLKAVKRIKELNLTPQPHLDFARDMFMLSFYTRGMSFIDMAYLKKSDLNNGILSYRRRKTGQRLSVKWEKCMQEIVDKHPAAESDFLLPIIRTPGDAQRQYRNALRLVNNRLKDISVMAGLRTNLTMYVSRHSWACAAKSRKIPLSVISEGMGHDSEATTQIYLASLDSSLIDKANKTILKDL